MLKPNERHGPGELAADLELGKGVHARDKLSIIRGTVEFNRDPDHRGRVKVRTIHDGPEMKILKPTEPRVPTFALNWCLPLFGYGSGAGFGAFTVPPVGARVWVMYEHGDPENGLYFGGWVAHCPRPRRYGATETTLKPPVKRKAEDTGFDESGNSGGDYYYPPRPTLSQGYWMEEQGPERPLELAEMVDHVPDTQLYFKTLKGASLLVKERDEAEEMVLTDRLGAELRFESNTPIVENGVLRRNRVSSTQHEAMSLDNLAQGQHIVSLLSASKAGLEIVSTNNDDDSLTLQAHAGQDVKRNVQEYHPERMTVELDPGEKRLRVSCVRNGEHVGVLVFDLIEQKLSIEGLDNLSLSSDKNITITAPVVKINGDLDVRGDIRHWVDHKAPFVPGFTESRGVNIATRADSIITVKEYK